MAEKTRLAIIKSTNNTVENCIVPPQGAQAFFVPNGYTGVLTTTGKIGDIYDATTGTFTTPPPEVKDEQQ